MKKKWLPAILLTVCAVLVANFVIFVIVDACSYDASFSAPFGVYVLIRALEFILPSVILFVIALLVLNKRRKASAAEQE